ncbi:hypothetical protein T265_05895 [Opisthorchis viverrini]|uniref:Uncharacterized protein n=1 Tax=Opisthorchis viverrini TaxID=6198 RepID=A0A074ZUB5_OPIVI|nr:hypothetical protein T265_05895 [Opisthorchis viverrini]KER26990.1 hypothetical protein T265_05895 [Opisthorchis viverrini]
MAQETQSNQAHGAIDLQKSQLRHSTTVGLISSWHTNSEEPQTLQQVSYSPNKLPVGSNVCSTQVALEYALESPRSQATLCVRLRYVRRM